MPGGTPAQQAHKWRRYSLTRSPEERPMAELNVLCPPRIRVDQYGRTRFNAIQQTE